jgi:glycosyltransferase involved in cell wall biosynthesis
MSMRIAHVITGLGGGGAEFMLARLCGALAAAGYDLKVISLTAGGPLVAHLRGLKIPLLELGMQRAADLPRGVLTLRRTLREFAPDLVQTWLCHADLIAGLVARYSLGVPVVWGVHQADGDVRDMPSTTRLVLRACAALASRVPSRVICCAEAGRRARLGSGFPAALLEVIPNGVDCTQFHPDQAARVRLRNELGVADDTLLIGMPARWHIDKDHGLLCTAARQVLAHCPQARFVLCGEGMQAHNAALAALIAATGHAQAFHLLGFRSDMAALLAALDVGVLSSRTEAFPNVIVETMACAVPFVATAVGDVATMIGAPGEAGYAVDAGDGAALAAALLNVLQASAAQRAAMGARARARVLERFSLATTVARYAAAYDDVLGVARTEGR